VVWVVASLMASSVGEAGTLYRWVDEEGRIQFSDTPPPTRQTSDLKVYQAPADRPTATTGEVHGAIPDLVIVDAEVNRRLTVRMRVDPGAEVTVLPKTIAKALGIDTLDGAIRHSVETGGRVIDGALTSLRWLRVGTAEARDVNVLVDLADQGSTGVLGQSFLRRFAMAVDDRGHVTFERVRPGR
jgi:clan AA aspartic protease (TIGR02281 family)